VSSVQGSAAQVALWTVAYGGRRSSDLRSSGPFGVGGLETADVSAGRVVLQKSAGGASVGDVRDGESLSDGNHLAEGCGKETAVQGERRREAGTWREPWEGGRPSGRCRWKVSLAGKASFSSRGRLVEAVLAKPAVGDPTGSRTKGRRRGVRGSAGMTWRQGGQCPRPRISVRRSGLLAVKTGGPSGNQRSFGADGESGSRARRGFSSLKIENVSCRRRIDVSLAPHAAGSARSPEVTRAD
jgi:hypothetical protein